MNSIVALPIAAALPVAAPAMDFPVVPALAPAALDVALPVAVAGGPADPVFAAIKKHKKAVRAVKAAGAEIRRLVGLADAAVGPRSIQVLDMREPSSPPGFPPFVTVNCWLDIEKYVSPEADAELYAHYRAKLEEQSKEHAKYLQEIAGSDIDEVMSGPAEAEWQAADELADVVPTSLPGLFAILTYVNRAMNAKDGIATVDEQNMTTLFGSLAKAARSLARQSARADSQPAPKASTDPMFGLIDAHRKALATWKASLDELDHLEEMNSYGPVDDSFVEGACSASHDTFMAVVGGAASTLPGLRAKAAYLQEIARSKDEAWVLVDYDDVATSMVEGFAASMENISA